MKLIPDWDQVLKRAWSVYLSILAAIVAILEIIDQALPVLLAWLPDGAVPWVQLSLALVGVAARVLQQRNLDAFL